MLASLLLACADPLYILPETDTQALEDTAALPARCPVHMVPVGDPVAFCMDAYEATVTGELGSNDQWGETQEPTLATASSEPGAIPSTALSFDQARAVCANTPAIDAWGEVYGSKRMPSSAEWEDAADGLVGPGGLVYVYGDEYDSTACPLAIGNNEAWVDGLQPTGSFDSCESPWGTLDQLGNVWEWADPQQGADIQAWLDAATDAGLAPFELDGLLGVSSADGVQVDIAGAQGNWRLDEEGRLTLDAGIYNDHAELTFKGFLHTSGVSGEILAQRSLPVQGVVQSDASMKLRILHEDDGVPFTDKRGGAWYSGGQATNHEAYNGHYHDFDGTIGVRCAADPY